MTGGMAASGPKSASGERGSDGRGGRGSDGRGIQVMTHSFKSAITSLPLTAPLHLNCLNTR